MRGVAILASVLITVVAAAATAQPNVAMILQPSILRGGSSSFGHAIASADIDDDGNIDLAVANDDTDDVSVLWGNGDGTFTPADTTFSVGTAFIESPVAIVIADIVGHGDGKLDIVTANDFADTVTVLVNQGGRTFAAAKESPTGPSLDTPMSPEAIAVDDFNGDGKLDVIAANLLDDSVTVLLGNGNGTFSILSVCSTALTQSCSSDNQCPSGGTCAPQVIPVGSEPDALVAVDLNHDGGGILDLVVANSTGGVDQTGSLTVLQGVGNGAFTCVAGSDPSCSASEITSPTFHDPVAMTTADLNDDGNSDLVIVNDFGGSLSVLLGNGDFTFGNAVALNVGESSEPEQAVVADLNGDGIPDIATSASLQDKVAVFVGQGNGSFAAALYFTLPTGSVPLGIVADDFNEDGKPDLAVEDGADPGTVSVLLNVSRITLMTSISAADTTITVTDAVPLPTGGMIVIDQERIIYTGKQGNTLIGVIRGANGTGPTAHAAGAAVTFVPPPACVGDCGGTVSVSVADILTMVNIALGNVPLSDCYAGDANGDGQVTVDEILSAVNNALNGCGA
jgi:hypothetical protein